MSEAVDFLVAVFAAGYAVGLGFVVFVLVTRRGGE